MTGFYLSVKTFPACDAFNVYGFHVPAPNDPLDKAQAKMLRKSCAPRGKGLTVK